MQDFIYFFGHGFCHQIPERTFEAGGVLLSVCARDTGIYIGFLAAVIAAFIVYKNTRHKPANMAHWAFIIVIVACFLPMAIDGGSSYLGLRETTNTIRYFTGCACGFAMGSLVQPLLFALRKDADDKQHIFAKPRYAVVHVLIATVLATLFFVVYPYLHIGASFLVIFAQLTILSSINLIMLTLSKRLTPKRSKAHWVFLLLLSLALALVEIALLGYARELAQTMLIGDVDLSGVL